MNVKLICRNNLLALVLVITSANAGFAYPSEKITDPKQINNFQIVECKNNVDIEFADDEKLFTFMAWLNWVSESNDKNHFDEYYEIKEILKTLPEETLEKHKQAYNVYSLANLTANNFSKIESSLHTDRHDIKGKSTGLKNGLMIYDSQYYSNPDKDFVIKKEDISFDDLQRTKNMPSAELIKEFYQKANIKNIWEQKYKKVNQRIVYKYAEKIKDIMSDTLCFLKTEQKYPVSFSFNLLNSFGISGQSSFSAIDKQYIIKIDLEPEYSDNYVLQVARHEFAHTILNDTIKKNSYLIESSLKKVAKALNLKDITLSPEELMAQNIENLNYAKSELYVRENVHFYYKNLLFMHFIDKIPEFLASGKSYNDYIPELFSSYDPVKEIDRWRRIEARIRNR